jgi:hypothetical protein
MLSKRLEIKHALLNQIKQYLNNEITRKTFGYVAEEYYNENAHLIEDTEFYKIYNQIVPDACLFYIDEPGYEDDKEKCFRREMEEVYSLLKPLCDDE